MFFFQSLFLVARTILVVDDNASVGQTLRFILAQRGYHVLVAEGGAQGLALALQSPVDGALIDMHMPGMNGIDTCRGLRANAALAGRTLAVWIITGAPTAEIRRQAFEAGALAVFAKPFDLNQVFRCFDEQFGTTSSPHGT